MKKLWSVLKQQSQQPVVWLSAGLLGIGSVILAAAVYQGQFVRYIADDFCTAGMLHTKGWWQAQVYWYQQWTGRFGFEAVIATLESTGTAITPWLPALTIIVWAIGLTWLLWKLATMRSYAQALIPAAALSVLALAMFVLTNPQPGQGFFWFTGNVTYTFPLVFITYMAVMACYLYQWAADLKFDWRQVFRSPKVWLVTVAIAALGFLTTSLNETHALAQIVLLGGIIATLIIIGLSRSRLAISLLPSTIIILLGTLASFVIMYLAPGNDIRSANYPDSPTISQTIIQTLDAINSYLVADWPYAWFIYLALATAVLVMLLPGRTKYVAITSDSLYRAFSNSLIVGLIGYGLLLLHYAPSYYVQHYPTEPRTYAAASFILALVAIVVGFIWGQLLASYQPKSGKMAQFRLVALLLVGLGLSWRLYQTQAVVVWQDNQQRAAGWQAYAKAWDERHHWLLSQANSQDTVYVTRLGYTMGLEDVSPNPDHWINDCLSDFYNLKTVIGQ